MREEYLRVDYLLNRENSIYLLKKIRNNYQISTLTKKYHQDQFWQQEKYLHRVETSKNMLKLFLFWSMMIRH